MKLAGPILLTGATGQVGGELLPLLAEFCDVIAPTRRELDLGDASAVRRMIRETKPRWVVNPAAYTAVDKAESDQAAAFAVNHEAVAAIGEEAAKIGAAVIHFSTDYVFAGDGVRPWIETDPTGPLGVYGASKLAGERALEESSAAALIFRTSWVYGATGKNFLRTILKLSEDREEMRIVGDQHGAPTWSRDLARLVVHSIRMIETHAAEKQVPVKEAAMQLAGVYHACDAGETTWFGFAEEFLRLVREANPNKQYARLTMISTSEYPTPARRPLNSRMNCEKLANRLGFHMPDWNDSVANVMAEVHSL